jgi:hypothetical protein
LRHALGGNEAVLPVAVEQQPFFRRVQDVALVVIRLLGKGIFWMMPRSARISRTCVDSGDGSGK